MPKSKSNPAGAKKKSLWTKPEGSTYNSPGEEYIFSPEEVSLKELGKKWKVHLRTIKSWSTKQNWVAKRRQYHEMVSEAVFKKNVEERSKRVDKLYDNLKFLWTAQIEALKQNLVDTNGGRAQSKKIKPSDLNSISQTCARISEWALLLEGVNIKEIPPESKVEDKQITITFGFGADDEYRSTV